MSTLAELKQALDIARFQYKEAVDEARPANEEVRTCLEDVKSAQRAISACITDGANACPKCRARPHGMEQPTTKGTMEYEVGCQTPTCVPFVHTDGTTREHRVRGGLLPRHAVEAWNAGPDFWMIKRDP